MDILKICGVVVLCLALNWVLKQRDVKFASLVSIFTVIVIGIYVVTALLPIIELLQNVVSRIDKDVEVLTVLLKVCGIQFITQMITSLCLESGERALASILEKAADIAILALSVPLLQKVFEMISKLLNDI